MIKLDLELVVWLMLAVFALLEVVVIVWMMRKQGILMFARKQDEDATPIGGGGRV